jgi:uncharacterized protein
MKELLKYVASMLVNEKEKVSVQEQDDGLLKKYTVTVAQADTKTIIGREGKTIKAIRSLISMAAINRNIKKKLPVEIVEE